MIYILIGEGSDDVGDPSGPVRGVVEILLRRLLAEVFDVEPEPIFETKRLKDVRSVRGFDKKVAAILLTETADRVLVVIDQDRDLDRRKQLEHGRSMAKDESRCVIGLAVEMLEAWLIADSSAWQRVFQREPTCLPPRPEDCWGTRNAASHPKNLLRQALQECGCVTAEQQSMAKRQLAEVLDLKILASKCPRGFGTLRHDIGETWFPWRE